VFLLILQKKKESFSDELDTCILLTTTVNTDFLNQDNTPEIRLKIYIDSINEWLNNTNLTLYVVESSNYDFPEFKDNPRVKVFSFISSNKIKCNRCFATPYEAESILKAFYYFKLNKYRNIIKVTGKYYIPGMETLIKNIPSDAEVFYQYTQYNGLQNSEIFGCQSIYLPKIMNKIIENSKLNMNFETTITSLDYKSYRFPPIQLKTPVKRSGDNKIMYIL
jgi:hypothetical protein